MFLLKARGLLSFFMLSGKVLNDQHLLRVGFTLSAAFSCGTDSCAASLPIAQQVKHIAQPAWADTSSVVRSGQPPVRCQVRDPNTQ